MTTATCGCGKFVTDIDVDDGVDKLAFTIVQDSSVFNLNPVILLKQRLKLAWQSMIAKVYGDDVLLLYADWRGGRFYGKFISPLRPQTKAATLLPGKYLSKLRRSMIRRLSGLKISMCCPMTVGNWLKPGSR